MLQERHMLVGRSVKNDLGLTGNGSLHGDLVSHVPQDRGQIQRRKHPSQSLLDPVEVEFTLFVNYQFGGREPRDLMAKLRTDRAATARDQYPVTFDIATHCRPL